MANWLTDVENYAASKNVRVDCFLSGENQYPFTRVVVTYSIYDAWGAFDKRYAIEKIFSPDATEENLCVEVRNLIDMVYEKGRLEEIKVKSMRI